MPGCRQFSPTPLAGMPARRVELRRYVKRGMRTPRAANDNRRVGANRSLYWALLVGAMPTLGLLAILSVLL